MKLTLEQQKMSIEQLLDLWIETCEEPDLTFAPGMTAEQTRHAAVVLLIACSFAHRGDQQLD
jgi:hypothetical protein